jgi:large conductance mechanosensitive channel
MKVARGQGKPVARGITERPLAAVKNGVTSFRTFITRPTLIDFLVAVSLGAVFTSMVTTLVKEVLVPLLFSQSLSKPGAKFWVVTEGRTKDVVYTSVDEARADGAAVVAYGRLMQAVAVFVGQALAVYAVMRLSGLVA